MSNFPAPSSECSAVFIDLYLFNWLLQLDHTESNLLFLEVKSNNKLYVTFGQKNLLISTNIHFTFQTILWKTLNHNK